jgi:hypothetical protein
MVKIVTCVVIGLALTVLAPSVVSADAEIDRRFAELEQRINNMPAPIQQHGSDGALGFLYGAVCALWAQNTHRNPWLWFFLGLFFSVITVIVLLIKNSDDRKRGRQSGIGFVDG